MARASPPIDLPRRILTGLARLAVVLRADAWQQHLPQRLTPTQGQALRLLHSRGNLGVRLSTVAAELGVRAPTASDAVRVLVDKRLVSKVRDLDDGRGVRLTLTRRGAQLAEVLNQGESPILEVVSALDPDEQEACLRSIIKIIRGLELQGALPVARMCVACEHFQPYAKPRSDKPHYCTFLDAPVGGADLRLDCPAHVRAAPSHREATWASFTAERPATRSRSPRRVS